MGIEAPRCLAESSPSSDSTAPDQSDWPPENRWCNARAMALPPNWAKCPFTLLIVLWRSRSDIPNRPAQGMVLKFFLPPMFRLMPRNSWILSSKKKIVWCHRPTPNGGFHGRSYSLIFVHLSMFLEVQYRRWQGVRQPRAIFWGFDTVWYTQSAWIHFWSAHYQRSLHDGNACPEGITCIWLKIPHPNWTNDLLPDQLSPQICCRGSQFCQFCSPHWCFWCFG